MKHEIFRAEQFIARPRSEVFAFFEKPENLARITPSSLGFKILSRLPIEMKEGAVIDYTIRLMGCPVRWTTLITGYRPPFEFSDIQSRGPYAHWHHTHTFEEVPGGVLMKDEVRYAVPFGILGRLVNFLWVRHDLNRIFEHRKKVISEIFA